MLIKTLKILCLFALIQSCNKKQNDNTGDVNQEQESKITLQDIAKFDYVEYALDDKTATIIQDWEEYKQLENFISEIKNGDFTFITDNEKAVKLAVEQFKDNIPKELKSPSIEARILVVETKLFKLESLYNLSSTSREELLSITKDFLTSFSNLNLQMNKKLEFDNRIIEKP